LPGLQIEKSGDKWYWRCWIVVKGVNTPASGVVDHVGDLENSLMERVKEVYTRVVGSPLPDSTP
jgi:hypothetical protein